MLFFARLCFGLTLFVVTSTLLVGVIFITTAFHPVLGGFTALFAVYGIGYVVVNPAAYAED